MTREKQIEEFANSQIDCEFFDDSLYKGIIIGANWADENPQMRKDYEFLFMLKKRELIEKGCKWLNNIDNIEKYLHVKTTLVDDLAKAFRKAMEE